MKPDMLALLIACWGSAIALMIYAVQSGASWPLPAALYMTVFAGIAHILASEDDDRGE